MDFRVLSLYLIVLSIFSLSCGDINSGKNNFKRVSFKISKNKSSILKFNKKTYSWNKNGIKGKKFYGKNITSGIGVDVKYKAVLHALPKSEGKKGITFTIFTYSPQKKLKISAYLTRSKKTIIKKIFEKNKIKKKSFTFTEEFDLKKNDAIVLKAKGKGTLIVSDLIVYNIIPKNQRKFLFIIALDNMSIGKIDNLKNNIVLTPTLNKLKKDSVFFSNAFAQSSWTYPSFMSMFSGLYEHNLNLNKKSFFPSDKPFLVEQLKKKFITVNFNGGAWLQPKYGASRGFDLVQYVSGTGDKFAGDKLFSRAIKYLNKNKIPNIAMFLHTYQVHSPFYPEEKFRKKINPSLKYSKLDNFTNRNQYYKSAKPLLKNSLIDLYDAEIMEFDSYLNKFITFLKSTGIYKQSTIVFLSDHGEEFHEHSGWFHGHSLYNELIKIPLMIKFPANKITPQRFRHNVGLLDLLPTILDFYKISSPINIDGISLITSITTGSKPRNEIYFSTSCSLSKNLPVKIGILTDQYKTIYNFPYTDQNLNYFGKLHSPPVYTPYEVYNLETDPKELTNLVKFKYNILNKNKVKLKKIIKVIKNNASKKNLKVIKLDAKETERLKSLGYL